MLNLPSISEFNLDVQIEPQLGALLLFLLVPSEQNSSLLQ